MFTDFIHLPTTIHSFVVCKYLIPDQFQTLAILAHFDKSVAWINKRQSAIYLFIYNFYLRCGNVAAILELNEHLQREFTIFEAAPQETRGIPSKKPQADYFL